MFSGSNYFVIYMFERLQQFLKCVEILQKLNKIIWIFWEIFQLKKKLSIEDNWKNRYKNPLKLLVKFITKKKIMS